MSDLGWHLELLSHDDDPDGWMYAQVRNYNTYRCERDRSEIRKHKRNTKCACLRVACSIRSATSHLSCFLASFLGSINQSINRWIAGSMDPSRTLTARFGSALRRPCRWCGGGYTRGKCRAVAATCTEISSPRRMRSSPTKVAIMRERQEGSTPRTTKRTTKRATKAMMSRETKA